MQKAAYNARQLSKNWNYMKAAFYWLHKLVLHGWGNGDVTRSPAGRGMSSSQYTEYTEIHIEHKEQRGYGNSFVDISHTAGALRLSVCLSVCSDDNSVTGW